MKRRRNQEEVHVLDLTTGSEYIHILFSMEQEREAPTERTRGIHVRHVKSTESCE